MTFVELPVIYASSCSSCALRKTHQRQAPGVRKLTYPFRDRFMERQFSASTFPQVNRHINPRLCALRLVPEYYDVIIPTQSKQSNYTTMHALKTTA